LAKKDELELVVEHWQTKRLATIQTRTNLLAMTKTLVGYALVAIQTYPRVLKFVLKELIKNVY
jgi:hypothetical protein